MKQAEPSNETVTNGTSKIGSIVSNGHVHAAYGTLDQYVGTFPTKPAARRALYELHKAGGEDRR